MHRAKAGAVERHAGQQCGKMHRLARFHVLRLIHHRSSQICANQANGFSASDIAASVCESQPQFRRHIQSRMADHMIGSGPRETPASERRQHRTAVTRYR